MRLIQKSEDGRDYRVIKVMNQCYDFLGAHYYFSFKEYKVFPCNIPSTLRLFYYIKRKK